MSDINRITEKYNRIVLDMPEKRKYFHEKSIYNFLIHYNDFGVEFYKSKVAHLLDDYLDFVISNEIANYKEGKYVFDKYIRPIGEIYTKIQGFIYCMKTTSILFFDIIFFFAFFLLELNVVYYLFIVSISGFIFFRGRIKTRLNKVYGFNY